MIEPGRCPLEGATDHYCILWLQMTSLPQNGSTDIQDILASFC